MTSGEPGNLKQALKLDLLVMLGLILVVIGFFAPTVFMGLPISKISRLAEWDSLFSAYRTGANAAMDPSLIQLMIPYYFLAADIWHSGQIPLWNPYAALGVPLLADIQAQAFSPLHLPFYFFPTMQVYNLELVSRVCLGVVSAYLFARSLQLPRYASVFASLSYCFCPYILWYSELMGAGYFVLPLVFCCFVRLAKNYSWAHLVAAGSASALLLLSAHPEITFFGILSAVACMCLLMVLNPELSVEFKGVITAAWRSVLLIFGCAAFTFCLSAPVLLPFAEYLLHSDSYKFATAACAYVPWQAVLYNLLQPGFAGASSYLGVVAAVVLPLALVLKNYRARCVAIMVALTFIVSCRIGPVEWLVEHKPFSYLMTIYCLPNFLLLTATLAAFGLQAAVEKSSITSKSKLLLLMLGVAMTLGVPLALWLSKVSLVAGKFDDALPVMSFSVNVLKRDLLLVLVFLLLVVLGKRLTERQRIIIAALCLGLNFISQGNVARASMPVQSKFDYPLVEPLKNLQDSHARVVSIGEHVLRPNTNVVYGISQLQCHSPMFPAGYLNFMRACGAQLEQYGQKFSGELRTLINLASVKLLVSQLPVTASAQTALPGQVALLPPAKDPLVLESAEYRYDPQAADLIGVLKWRSNSVEPQRFTYLINVLDESGKTLWFSDQYHWQPSGDDGISAQKFAVPLSLHQVRSTRLLVGVRLFDTKLSKFVDSTAPAASIVESVLVFAHLQMGTPVPATATTYTNPYELKLETDNQIRVYENPAALPAAYIAHKIVRTSNADALQIMSSKNFDARNTVVLEQSFLSSDLLAVDLKGVRDVVKLSRPDTNSVVLDTQSAAAGVLVLTDMYFPGWTAYLDGKQVPIGRANHLMRAVHLPQGRHQVKFVYDPLSFRMGMWLLLACLSGIGIASLGAWYRNRQVKNVK